DRHDRLDVGWFHAHHHKRHTGRTGHRPRPVVAPARGRRHSVDRVTGANDDEKDAIRRAVRASRLARPDAERTAAADAIAQRGSALVARAGAATVACYLSSPDAPPTRAHIAALQPEGIRVLLPMIRPGRVLDWGEHAGEERRTRLGVPETVADPLGP